VKVSVCAEFVRRAFFVITTVVPVAPIDFTRVLGGMTFATDEVISHPIPISPFVARAVMLGVLMVVVATSL
jgi:hypothetical protein